MQHTHVVMVLDQSGSMATKVNDVIGGFNTFLEGLKDDHETEYHVTLYTFANTVNKVYRQLALAEVPDLDKMTYVPSGGTALYDAVGKSIKATVPNEGEKILVVIQTDGEENASTAYTQAHVKDLIEAKMATGQWAFLYLGADMSQWAAERAASMMGIGIGNTVSYDGANTQQTISSVSGTAQAYSSNTVNPNALGQTVKS